MMSTCLNSLKFPFQQSQVQITLGGPSMLTLKICLPLNLHMPYFILCQFCSNRNQFLHWSPYTFSQRWFLYQLYLTPCLLPVLQLSSPKPTPEPCYGQLLSFAWPYCSLHFSWVILIVYWLASPIKMKTCTWSYLWVPSGHRSGQQCSIHM